MMHEPIYLPFLHGPAKVAPQLRPIPLENWLPPERGTADWIGEKRRLIRDRYSDVIAHLDGADAASLEAAHYVWCHLEGTDPASRAIDGFSLETVSQHVSDDLCVMVPKGEGFYLGSASLCAPTYWSLRENIGKPLGGLHSPVPGGDPELASRINRVFSGLKPDTILERFNWTVQLGSEKFTPSSEPFKARLKSLSDEEAASDLYLRVERQTIRKLPETGAVLFTIRILVDALPPILDKPAYRQAFAASWNRTASDLASYKGWPQYEPAIRFLLDV
tara:strand:+ start:5238 stop:6065 length:828 start_codon:yes stop_codon:yes gene_type:complete